METHVIIPLKHFVKIGEKLMKASEADNDYLFDEAIEVDLSEAHVRSRATRLYTTHSLVGYNTFTNGISVEGYCDAIKELLNGKI